MLLKIFNAIFLLSLLLNSYSTADEECQKGLGEWHRRYRHTLYVGPEVYHVERTREGGSRQSGTLVGGRMGYDYLRRYNVYFGWEGFYAGSSTLNGRSAAGNKIKSEFTDMGIEGRIGYTFEQKYGMQFSFTPFVGYGYGMEKNHFIHPSPLRIHFKIRYSYVPIGFLSKVSLSPYLDAGINFKVKYIVNAKNKVTHDPEFGSTTMLVKNETHYRVDIPFTYYNWCHWNVCVDPFYEYRIYGGQPNYPFDFLETKLNIYGVTLKLQYSI